MGRSGGRDQRAQRERFALQDLLEGARSGRLGESTPPAYRFHRAPRWEALGGMPLADPADDGDDVYYLRVRQVNDSSGRGVRPFG